MRVLEGILWLLMVSSVAAESLQEPPAWRVAAMLPQARSGEGTDLDVATDLASGVDRLQVSAGEWLNRLGLWREDPVANYACSRITDGDLCVQSNCVWCATDQQCHAAGSFMDPCTNDCCATTSWRSTCFNSQVAQIPSKCNVRARNTTVYDPEVALSMVHFAAAAYCNETAILDWNCRPCEEMNFTPHTLLRDDELDLQGLVGVWHTQLLGSGPLKKYIVISFRGTISSSLVDWISDLTYTQITPYEKFPSVEVHEGFYNAYTHSLQQQILDVLAQLPDVPILVTGHSLGASIAVLCAFDLKVFKHKELPAVYTYGQPRVGNFNFAVTYAKHVPNLWRVTHHFDIVPHIPTTIQNFYHSQHEVYYAANDTNYVVCDKSGEDNNCSNSCSRTLACRSISDHLLYLSIPLGSDVC